MFTCRRVAAFIVFSLSLSVLPAPSGARGPTALAADHEEAPEFRSDSAASSFESGLRKFKSRDYAGARADFKKARSSGKGKDDKAIVDRWIRAADGGEDLLEVRRFVLAAQHRDAYDRLTEVYVNYLGTPIAKEYESDWKKLASRVATVVEGFDSNSRYYETAPGRRFVEGEEQVLSGSHCLSWKRGKESDKTSRTVTLRRVPEDWSEYDEVELWYNARVAPLDMHIVLSCGRRGEDDEKDDREHKLTAQVRMKGKGWNRLRLPIDEFTSVGIPCLTKVEKVELTIQDDRDYDFMLDSIALLKSSEDAAEK